MEGIAQAIRSAGVTATFHAVTHTNISIQLGHELLPHVQITSIFRLKIFCHLNLFKYMSHICKLDDFFGMYHGLGMRLVDGVFGSRQLLKFVIL